MAAAVAEAATSSLGQAQPVSLLASPSAHFLETTKSLASTTRQRWIDGEIELNAADASIAALEPLASQLKASLVSQTTPESSAILRDLITSELRYLLAASLGDEVSTAHEPSIVLTIHAILDVTTAYQQVDLVDGGLTLTLIEEINERLTVDGACEVFEYLESRAAYLTQGVSPSKGKGLVLLRLLNDLLRRLSKPSRSHLVLSGRILSLLSSVFPLGDRSGVNLRGEFNTANVTRTEETDGVPNTRASDTPTREQEEENNNKDADPSAIAAKDDAFYNSFWNLQRYFANPVLLFEPAAEQQVSSDGAVQQQQSGPTRDPVERLKAEEAGASSRSATPQQHDTTSSSCKTKDDAATTAIEEEEGATRDEAEDNADAASSSNTYAPPLSPLESFKESTRRVLDVFSEASSREREVEMAEKAANKGATTTAAAKKRKREEMLQSYLGAQLDVSGGATTTTTKDEAQSSFPKYLTGRKVFEYQLRSPPFRRHVLLQYLILFQYLLSFNPNQKEKTKEWKNQQLLLSQPLANEFTLEDADEKWIRQSWREIVTLLEETGPRNEGRGFKSSVLQTLRRESRWISWKADNCPAIDKPGLKQDLIERFRTSFHGVFFKPRPKFPHSVGTSALSELWEDGLEPIVPGTRLREDEEGNEVQVTTDGLEQLELPPGIASIDVYAKKIKLQEMKEQMRLRKLGIVDTTDEEQVNAKIQSDEELKLIREQIDSLNWRALRIARGSSLRLWSKIATGDVQLLLKAEKDEEESKRRKVEEAEQVAQGEKDKNGEPMQDDTTGTGTDPPVTEEATTVAEADAPDATTTTEAAAEAMDEDEPIVDESATGAEGGDAGGGGATGPPADAPKTTEAVDVPAAQDAPTTTAEAVDVPAAQDAPTTTTKTEDATAETADPDATIYVDASADLNDEDDEDADEDTYSPTVEDIVPEDTDMAEAKSGV